MLKTKEDNSGSKLVASSQATVSAEHYLLFISPANPEDNSAASWFATQLTLLGYDVWCDLKNICRFHFCSTCKAQKGILDNELAQEKT